MKKTKLKALIELALTAEDADRLIVENTPYQDTREKYIFIDGLFDFKIIGRSNTNIEADYLSALTAIIKNKWR